MGGGGGGVIPRVWKVGLMAGPCVESSKLEISISPASKEHSQSQKSINLKKKKL